MNNFEIKIGDIVTFVSGKSYRIIYVDENEVILCLLNTKKLNLSSVVTAKIVDDIQHGMVNIETQTQEVPDLEHMNETDMTIYKRNLDITRKVAKIYGPKYEILATKKPKPELKAIAAEAEISDDMLRIIIVRYIQSGFSLNSLNDHRNTENHAKSRSNYNYKKRPGRQAEDEFASRVILTKDIKKQFDEAIAERKSGRCKTYESAYTWMVNKYYSETFMENGALVIKLKKESKIPSLRQFTNYARNHTTKKETDIANTSLREVRNDKRLLLGDSFNDVLGPGDLCEIDAVEVDVSLVSSSDRTQVIGRPIMYLMIDIYTRMILAMSVSLHNNAMIALTNLFLNLSDNKKEFCERYGHSIKDEAWISNIIPRRIRVDRGSDFASNQFGDICAELGIDRQLVPAAMGSLKGSIEQEFRTLHAAQKPHLEGNGVIMKRYDSNHHRQATLTIEEYTAMAIDFVLHHNIMACENYPYTADMVKNGVHAIPAELWAYGSKIYGSPKPIINIDAFRYSLMKKTTGKLDRSGLTVNGLSYINLQDKDMLTRMYELQNKREKFEVRIDPRDVSNVYYLKSGKLMVAHLNPAKTENIGYEGMTLFELEEYKKKQRALKKEGQMINRRAKNSLYAAQEAIVKSAIAEKPKGPNNTKNIREAREIEKQRIANENRIAKRLNLPQQEISQEEIIDAGFIKKEPIKELADNQISQITDSNDSSWFEQAMKDYEESESD